uniref:Uncharacterized protein n=1 Tax=Cucumis melo TaxID=3656 RepID=A0A9I9E4V4_CUCME
MTGFEHRTSTTSANTMNDSSSNIFYPFVISLTNNTSSLQNNDLHKNKEVETFRRYEACREASNTDVFF